MNLDYLYLIPSGIGITVLAYVFGLWLYKRTNITFLNPILTSMTLIIIVLLVFKIPLEKYQVGGNYIAFFLKPVTVMLAIPMYRQYESLKKHFTPILIGVMSSVLLSFSIIFVLSKLFGLDDSLAMSLYPKSITTPMGYELSVILNGLPPITVFSIIITGITGAVTAPWVLKIANIKSKIAKGIAIGSSSHALGTSKAFEIGEVEGAMSSLAIALTGLVTVLVVPLLVKLFG